MTGPDAFAPRRSVTARLGLLAALLVLGLLLWARGATTGDTARPARALLINFLYFVPLAAGFSACSAGLALSRAKWAGRLEIALLKGVGFALPSFFALAGLWMLSRRFGYWGAGRGGVGLWLAQAFVFGRDAVLLLVFWAVAWFYAARRQQGKGERSAGMLLILYVAVFSMIGFDLSMSLTAPWKSTVYGLYFAVSGLYIAVAAWTLFSVVNPSATKIQLHDLGKTMVGMSLLSAYLMVAQVLTIWYGNLPAETGFLVDRLRTAQWRAIDMGLIASVYLGPLVLLLPARFKRNRLYLGAVAALVLAGMWIERFWLVVPASGASPVIGIPEIAMTGAFIGALGIVFAMANPKADPCNTASEYSPLMERSGS